MFCSTSSNKALDAFSLAQKLDLFKGQGIFLLGDVMIDRFTYGAVDRISPEAPIPVLGVQQQVSMLGGAGNVMRNLSAFGLKVWLLSVIGDDAAGQEIKALVATESHEGDRHDLLQSSRRPTTVKERFLANNQQLLRTDRESRHPLDQDLQSALLAQLRDRLSESLNFSKVLVLSDYGKGVLTRELLQQAISLAQAADCWTIVDPKGPDYSVYRGASLMTPNRKELHEATGLPLDGDDNIVRACQWLINNCGVKAVLATRSEEGMTLVEQSGQIIHFSAQAREVFDVSGAGDTVVALVASGLAAGLPLEEAIAISNVAAGIVVGKAGTAVTSVSEVRQSLLEDSRGGLFRRGQVSDLELCRARAEQWKKAGYRVGFTNGCFDIFHRGHVSILRRARENCDRLIVGLNSDASIKRLKGENRPIHSEKSRAAVVAANEAVDQVVIFDEDTPLDLIKALKPDLLVKGEDYKIEDVVGAREVLGWGGEVFLAPLEEGHSTTAAVKKIQARKGW